CFCLFNARELCRIAEPRANLSLFHIESARKRMHFAHVIDNHKAASITTRKEYRMLTKSLFKCGLAIGALPAIPRNLLYPTWIMAEPLGLLPFGKGEVIRITLCGIN